MDPITPSEMFKSGSTVKSFHSLTFQHDSGVVNPAYQKDDSEEEEEEEDSENEEMGEEVVEVVEEVTHTRGGGASLPLPFDKKQVANGHPVGLDTNLHGVNPRSELRVGFEENKPTDQPPPVMRKSKGTRKSWDRFTSTTEESVSSQDVAFWNKVFIVTKVVVAILLFFIVLGTTVVNKLCFIIATANIYTTGTMAESHAIVKTAYSSLTFDTNSTDVKWIWALIMMMGAPYVFTVISSLWRLCMATGAMPLQLRPLLWVMFIETCHSVGLNLMVYVLVPSFDPVSGLLLVLSVGVVPSALKIFNPSSRKEQKGIFTLGLASFLSIVALCGQLGSIALWCYYTYRLDNDTFEKTWLMAMLIISPVLISATWWENFINHKSRKRQKTFDSEMNKKNKQEGLISLVRKTRTKLLLIANLWKLCLNFIIPLAIIGLTCEQSSSQCIDVLFFTSNVQVSLKTLSGGITQLVDSRSFGRCNNYLPLVVAAVGILSSGVCYKACKTACKIMTQIVDFSLPLAFSTPASIGIVLGMYSGFVTTSATGCSIPFPKWNKSVTLGNIFDEYWVPAAAGIAAYFSLLLVTNYIWAPGPDRLQTTRRLFVLPLYCGVLMDQSLILNRRRVEGRSNVKDTGKKRHREIPLPDIDMSTLSEASSSPYKTEATPMIYMCATMWHETENEMAQLLKSILRMDDDQCTRKNTQLMLHRRDNDYYEFEAHIFFDDAFQGHSDTEFEFTVNDYVKQLLIVVEKSARDVHKNYKMRPPLKIATPYGGRLEWTLPGGNMLIAHLKDKAVIRHKKRWSQVMYMYYFLAHKLLKKNLPYKKLKRTAENTFLLALDGDVDFQPRAVHLLLDRMKKNEDVGAACGRIHPIGSGAMVWYQKFEYAVSHWLQKAAEDKFGCVLCSPGCFSLFRGSALMSENVMQKYTTVATEPRHYVQYDQGEDRWLCTLLLQQGHRVEYCAASDALTFAPEGFNEFFNQRRRWTPSTMANIMDLLTDWKNVIRKNGDISLTYICYQGFLMVSSILTPGTIFLMILGAINLAYPDIELWLALFINFVPLAILVALCFLTKSGTQLTYAAILSVAYSLIMMIVIVGLLRQVADYGLCSVTSAFLLFVAGVFVIAGFVHPQEFGCIFHGFLYFLSIPAMSMVLMLYSLCNLHVVSWGTRENTQPTVTSTPKKPERHGVAGWINKQFGGEGSSWFDSICQCCSRTPPNNDLLLDRLDDIENKIIAMSTRGTSHVTNLSQTNNSVTGNSETLFGNGPEKTNPVYKEEPGKPRKQLVNPYWLEDKDFKTCERGYLEADEVTFFEELIDVYLKPLEKNTEKEKKAANSLKELRNKVCLIFILLNALFIIVVFTLQQVTSNAQKTNTHALSLKLPCATGNGIGQSIEPISVAFTLVFGILLFVQFCSMVVHRLATLTHVCASTTLFEKKYISKIGFGSEEEKTVKVTFQQGYQLVKELEVAVQEDDTMSIASESSIAESIDDIDDMVIEAEQERKKKAKMNWKRLTHHARRQQGPSNESLTANFLKSFSSIRPEEDEETVEKRFKGLSQSSRKTLKRIVNDSSFKEKYNNLPKSRWKIALAKSKIQSLGDNPDGKERKISMEDIVNLKRLKNQEEKLKSVSEDLDETDAAVAVCNSTPGTPTSKRNDSVGFETRTESASPVPGSAGAERICENVPRTTADGEDYGQKAPTIVTTPPSDNDVVTTRAEVYVVKSETKKEPADFTNSDVLF